MVVMRILDKTKALIRFSHYTSSFTSASTSQLVLSALGEAQLQCSPSASIQRWNLGKTQCIMGYDCHEGQCDYKSHHIHCITSLLAGTSIGINCNFILQWYNFHYAIFPLLLCKFILFYHWMLYDHQCVSPFIVLVFVCFTLFVFSDGWGQGRPVFTESS